MPTLMDYRDLLWRVKPPTQNALSLLAKYKLCQQQPTSSQEWLSMTLFSAKSTHTSWLFAIKKILIVFQKNPRLARGDSREAEAIQETDELSPKNRCVMWGSQVIVPDKLREPILKELHRGHPGITRMKAVARSYLWCSGMDQTLEDQVKIACHVSQIDTI